MKNKMAYIIITHSIILGSSFAMAQNYIPGLMKQSSQTLKFESDKTAEYKIANRKGILLKAIPNSGDNRDKDPIEYDVPLSGGQKPPCERLCSIVQPRWG
jgi:hypothetical protein